MLGSYLKKISSHIVNEWQLNLKESKFFNSSTNIFES